MASQWGTLFRVSTFGESHGPGVGCVIDGCPPGVRLDRTAVVTFLARRRPGQNAYTSPRSESDTPEFLSGLSAEGVTLGSPIAILVRNINQRSSDYSDMAAVFRPSHADYTTLAKFGVREAAGGGRSSARETIGRVAAAAVAKQVLQAKYPGLEVIAWVDAVATHEARVDPDAVTFEGVEASPIRCPDTTIEERMKAEIDAAREAGDTVGGVVGCVVRGMPVGLGEPVFDKLEADFAKALLSLPAAKSFEVGSGLAGTRLRGSQHNDPFVRGEGGRVRTATNNSGGIQGGISNGMPITMRVGFKPVSTLFQEQRTVDAQGNEVAFAPKKGRHDSCVLPRAVPMVEAMVWLTLVDHWLRQVALVQSLPAT